MKTLVKRAAAFGLILAATVTPGSAQAKDGVLVFGGTGRLGSHVAIAYENAGREVTVFARPSSSRDRLNGLNVSFVTGDVLNEADVEAALKSGPYRIVVDALARDSDVDPAFYIDSMKYIAKWSKETGVAQVILHGSVGAGISQLSDRDPDRDFGPLFRAKGLGERYLMESGVPYTIIRNWALVPEPAKQSGNAVLTPDQTARGLISRDALAAFSVQCTDNPDCINEIFHTYDDDVETVPRFRQRLEDQRAWEASQK